jgi:predicted O-methyltransferase YrrM
MSQSFVRRVARRLGLRALLAPREMPIQWTRRAPGWLADNMPGPVLRPPAAPAKREIERRARLTEAKGPQPLWSGYRAVASYRAHAGGETRTSEDVRTQPVMGDAFAWLAARRRPGVLVECGSAFGVSGMYWLSGLEQAGAGEFLGFEPNEIWAAIAEENLAAIGRRFRLVRGTFEDHLDAVLGGRPIDLAFIDAIHTSAFVNAQYDIVRRHAGPGALVLLDDITFSDDMAACWRDVAERPEVRASLSIAGRVGVVELA